MILFPKPGAYNSIYTRKNNIQNQRFQIS